MPDRQRNSCCVLLCSPSPGELIRPALVRSPIGPETHAVCDIARMNGLLFLGWQTFASIPNFEPNFPIRLQ
jgi:hypothetical protein